MAKKLFVGNLSYNVSNDDLVTAFSEFGETTEANVVMDRNTGRSRGFGFVEFTEDAAADAAIEKMNGADLQGRTIVVNVAKPPRPRNQNFS